jgi:hypothetical protein
MVIQPADWSVVIVGRWNRAILTPAGISKRVFNIEDQKQIMVLVPLDGVSPYIVKLQEGDIAVRTDEKSLRIDAEKPDFAHLERVMSFGVNAITSLPETPLEAVGINVNYESGDLNPQLATLIAGEIDKQLSSIDYKVTSRAVIRTYELNEGQLNIRIIGEKDLFKIYFNFHRSSINSADLVQWLKTPIGNIQNLINTFFDVLKIELEEIANDSK